MAPLKSNLKFLKTSTLLSCLLCSKKCRRKYENLETDNKNLFELLMNLYDLWDKEFTESAEDTLSSVAFETATFCKGCGILIREGLDLKRKLEVVKEEIANHVEGDISDAEPGKKILQSFIVSTRLDTDTGSMEAENSLESCNTGHEDHTYSITASPAFFELSTMPSIFMGDSDQEEDIRRVPVDGNLLTPQGNTTKVSFPACSKFKTGLVTKPSAAKEANQYTVAGKRRAQTKLLQPGSGGGGTKEKKRRVTHTCERPSELSSSESNDESSNLDSDLRTNVTDESITSSSASKIESTTRPVKCLVKAKGIPRKPAFKSKPSNPERKNELSDNGGSSVTAVHEENPDNPNAGTADNNTASNPDCPELQPQLENKSAITYYATPSFMIKSGILKPWESKKLKWTRLYKCFFCDERFCSGISLRLHLQLTHNEGGTSESAIKFKCPRCLKEFEKSVFDHDLKPKNECFCHHFGERTVTRMASNANCCSQKTFETFAEQHLRGCKGFWYLMPQPDEQKEECISCGQDFPLDLQYYAHLRTHYQTDLSEMFSCQLCVFQTFRSRRSDTHGFKSHLRNRHGISICGNEQYFCIACNSIYMPLNPDLESGRLVPEEYAHFKQFALEHSDCENSTATRQTEFKCKWCPEIKNTPRDLIAHEGTVHTKKVRKCDQCDFECFENNEFKAHMKLHVRDFVCDRCAKAFATKTRLKIHIEMVHLGVRNFMCEECGSTFFCKTKLHQHMESVHCTTRDAPCPQCGKLFKSKRCVRDHVYQVHKIQRKAKPRQKKLEADGGGPVCHPFQPATDQLDIQQLINLI